MALQRMMVLAVTAALVGAVACSGGAGSGGSGGSGGGGGAGSGGGGSGGSDLRCEPALVRCEDESFQLLDLQDSFANGLITNTDLGTHWESVVDATAGGLGANPPDAYVYAQFTETGLRKRQHTDEQGLTSMVWDLAFRRYIIRMNSGTSGPSCVEAVELAPGTSFADVATVPPAAELFPEDFFTATCDPIVDNRGDPQSYLATYWDYPNCVAMSGAVFIVHTAADRYVKLEVLEYYGVNQAGCDVGGTPGGNAGMLKLRWAFLD